MATKQQQSQVPPEDNMASQAPTGPCGYLYAYPLSDFPIREAAELGNMYDGGSALSLPLLQGLTVEHGFSFCVKAAHRKVDATTLLVRVTSYHAEAVVFHNAEKFLPVFHGPGLDTICHNTRMLFGYTTFKPRDGVTEFNVDELCAPLGGPNHCICAAVFTEGFKERLYFGKLVPLCALLEEVKIGCFTAFRMPLYDQDLFTRAPNVQRFYRTNVSQYLHDALYTNLAICLRIRNAEAVALALEQQFVHDQYKVPKLGRNKEFPAGYTKQANATQLAVVDAAAAELALSYGLAFVEAPHDPAPTLNYETWPVVCEFKTVDERVMALKRWNAQLAIHVHAQLFSANSVLYVTRVARQQPSPGKPEASAYNKYFLAHGLGHASSPTCYEDGQAAFDGVPTSRLDGSAYTLEHLVYAAAFSPHLLARYCYYLQFCQHQRSAANASYNIVQYVGSAANSTACVVCNGECPASCINTLLYRLHDRFPPVQSSQRRDPIVITGSAGAYNELDYLGNFASMRDRGEEDGTAAASEDIQRYTYWQLTHTVLERLEALGVREAGNDTNDEVQPSPIVDAQSFCKLFRDIDAIVDAEVLKFMNALARNNVNYREAIKGAQHVMQYSCNPYWQTPCSIFLTLFYRSILTVLQDISLPITMMYEIDNPSTGLTPGDWLRLHYQILWTNYKGMCMDKGALTGSECRVVHRELFCDFFDVDAAVGGNGSCMHVQCKLQVRIARALVTVPKTIKVKNRIVFNGASVSETLQNSFMRSTARCENYIINGPYMKFLHEHHKLLFPGTKISALYMWHTFSRTKKLPIPAGMRHESALELAAMVNTGSRAHEDANVLDATPDSLVAYARQRINNALLRACGQTQYYACTIQGLLPRVQDTTADEYPHALGTDTVSSPDDYTSKVCGRTVVTVQTTPRQSIAATGKLRPVVTLPVVVNKYQGINGNAQIFHCANLGYFMGRGVDRNLLSDTSGFRRGGSSNVRKRHVFVTPLVGALVSNTASTTGTGPFEVETVRRNIQALLADRRDDVALINAVVVELVRSLGASCTTLSDTDAKYFLGTFDIVADELLERLGTLTALRGPWTADWAAAALAETYPVDADVAQCELLCVDTTDGDGETFAAATEQFTELAPTLASVSFDDPSSARLTTPSLTATVGGPLGQCSTGRKRKIGSVLGGIEL
uniref:Single-stranded DNA-binding protein n=1 Tax=Otarine gammaherpesvirus 4 TaxID=2801541 RepID=A0A889IW13_9GAMA|nr:Single-stranded DNA-binding protein [Otarine gammaherpesvirus 4]